jgi:ABC-type antimicrobial peptide transport system permease subunit
LQADPEPAAYFSQRQFPFRNMHLYVRGPGDAAALLATMRESLRRLDPSLPLAHVETLDDVLQAPADPPRLVMSVLMAFALLALVLAAIGIYGVLSYAVNSRRREIGIRMALGAHRGNVVPMVAWHGMRMVLLGVLLGIAGAVALTRFIESLLFEVSTVDPVIYLVVAGAVVAVAALACLMPALRAARLDATEALRA